MYSDAFILKIKQILKIMIVKIIGIYCSVIFISGFIYTFK